MQPLRKSAAVVICDHRPERLISQRYNPLMPIRRLPPLVVNQIAAGEVIERPASVVKELVENSIDSGATRIDITIENGGTELVQVRDNGCGIPMEELLLAIAPHATSKIQSTDDLDAIASMGFRGEALASIASVSRMAIVSRPAAQEAAAILESEGDSVTPVRPCGGPVGTSISVRNLFFNTPARRKFLRTEQTETTRVGDIVDALALAHPKIAFSLTVDGRKTLDLPPDQSMRRRALEILGPELESELLEVEPSDHHGLSLWGLAGRPAIARGTSKHQRIYLNGRPISDRSITHAIKEAYRGLIDPTRHPTIVLMLEVDPAQVDVNVHPAKAEVRFRNQGIVHSAVLGAVRGALHKGDLVPAVSFSDGARSAVALPAFTPPEFGTGFARTMGGGVGDEADGSNEGRLRGVGESGGAVGAMGGFVDYFRRLDPQQKSFVYSEVKQAIAEALPNFAADAEVAGASEVLPMVRSVTDVLQVHASYIVTQDEQGILIIDQHALHERVMFEKLREQVGKGNLESQRLLMPATVELDPSAMEQLGAMQSLLTRIGVEAEAIGPKAVAVHAFPSFLFDRGVEPVEFLRDLLERAAREGPMLTANTEAALHETLDMMACKAAVKAGDRLTQPEIVELLKFRETVDRATNCPHGRPTTLRLSLRDLEKQFGRR